MLVKATVLKNHDAVMRSGFAVTQFHDLGFDMHRVAMKQRCGKPHFVPAQIGQTLIHELGVRQGGREDAAPAQR